MKKQIEVVTPIPNDYWTGKNETCLLAVCGANILSAVCVKEPNEGEEYTEEILQVSHTDILLGNTVVLGRFKGEDFRSTYTNEHWGKLEENGLERQYFLETLSKYKL